MTVYEDHIKKSAINQAGNLAHSLLDWMEARGYTWATETVTNDIHISVSDYDIFGTLYGIIDRDGRQSFTWDIIEFIYNLAVHLTIVF
jgi:hypothetical protein